MKSKSEGIYEVTILIFGIMSLGFTSDHSVWKKVSSGINESVINCVAVHPLDNNLIFAGTPKALYRSMNKGKSYQIVLQVQGSLKGINDIYMSSLDQRDAIYVATDSGLFVSRDKGDHWETIYDPKDIQSRRCLSVTADPYFVYVGTGNGLLYKFVNSPLWHREEGDLGNKTIYGLFNDRDYLYIATGSRLYRSDRRGKVTRKIFSLGYRDDDAAEDFYGESDDVSSRKRIKDIVVLNGMSPEIFLFADTGIFHSSDQGETWERFLSHGLPLEDMTSISAFFVPATGQLHLFAGTKRGVYGYDSGRWLPLYKGMETDDIRFLSHDGHQGIYAATDKGVFFIQTDESKNPVNPIGNGTSDRLNYAEITEQFRHEPSILEVHDIAVGYAEVHPDKIKRWRTAAKIKALLPDLSVGIDRAATDLFHWDTGAKPDELLKGLDYLDWDVSLSWDLADLVWSTDQTTIDSRSKSMVELREDILGQITRLYFERRRIQVELMAAAYAQPQIKIEKQMRVEELTALIDALTGGDFSRRIAIRKNNHKEKEGTVR